MGLDYPGLLADLRHESDRLIEQLNGLAYEQWGLATPAQGWSIQDQVSHLAFFDETARLALTEPDQFRALADTLMADGMDFPDRIAAQHRILAPDALLDWFIAARRELLGRLVDEDPRRRLPWFGPDMSAASSATARLMETWAHGQDIYDTVGVEHPLSAGLRSIAHLGVTTFGFAHTINGLDVPDKPVRVELLCPDGQSWTGAQPMPPIGSPARRWISCSPSPSAGTGVRPRSPPPGRRHHAGSTSPRRSPGRRRDGRRTDETPGAHRKHFGVLW
jgi:uncharacterized protein (TIGR03084 family)